jgi:hypothetical protein
VRRRWAAGRGEGGAEGAVDVEAVLEEWCGRVRRGRGGRGGMAGWRDVGCVFGGEHDVIVWWESFGRGVRDGGADWGGWLDGG